jgi:oligopeptidase B
MVKNISLQGGKAIKSSDYEQKLVMVPAHDGEEIPMMLMHSKNLPLNRKNRTIMEAYGSYGLNMQQGFNIMNLSAMERGWVIA